MEVASRVRNVPVVTAIESAHRFGWIGMGSCPRNFVSFSPWDGGGIPAIPGGHGDEVGRLGFAFET